MSPNQIPLGVYTHLNYAFVSIDPATFRIVDMDSFTGSLYSQITALKLKDPNLEIWVSVGGWSFNDPGSTATTFSTLSRDTNAQQAFFASLITFMVNNGFDGVDIDWYAAFSPTRHANVLIEDLSGNTRLPLKEEAQAMILKTSPRC